MWSVLMLPALQVAYVGLVDPPTTMPIALRWLQGKIGRAHQTPAVYRWVPIEAVPESFLTCVWQAEDDRFFEHAGFDWPAIKAAWAYNQAAGRLVAGGSTITQQCARSLFLWQGRSWLRKGLEAYYTAWMETLLSKRRILELYVNVMETGDGLYGVEAAAERYYRIPAAGLSRDQSALLVAILPNPRHWSVTEPSDRVLSRKTNILHWAEHAKLPGQVLR